MLTPQKGSHSNMYRRAMPQRTSQLEALGDWIRPERVDIVMDTVSSVAQFVSDSLQPHGLKHARPPCPSPTPGACSDSCPSSR